MLAVATSALLLGLRQDSSTASQTNKDSQTQASASDSVSAPARADEHDSDMHSHGQIGAPAKVAQGFKSRSKVGAVFAGSPVPEKAVRKRKMRKRGVVDGVVGGVVNDAADDIPDDDQRPPIAGCPGGVPPEAPAPSKKGSKAIEAELSPPEVEEQNEVYEGPRLQPQAPAKFDLPLVSTHETRFATISTDVDTGSYTRARSMINNNAHLYAGSVRVEEFINYFNYDSPPFTDEHPIAVLSEMGPAPWNQDRKLLRVGVAAKAAAKIENAPRNLVFLLDVSGSMHGALGLDLVKYGLSELTKSLTDKDRVSIVVYAGASGEVLAPTPGDQKETIIEALEELQAGGGTNGAEGISLAYQLAEKNFVKGGINRVILATDGDFNVGTSSVDELVEMVENRRDSGIYLSVLGVQDTWSGDTMLEQIADHGNGNYAFLDSKEEARRVLIDEAAKTLNPVADNVKIQIEFNPDRIAGHRVIGYENRRLSRADFMNDKKDAGDMGDGQIVTAIYEVELKKGHEKLADKDFAKIAVRYRPFGQKEHRMFSSPHRRLAAHLDDTSEDFRFASSVALFGQLAAGEESNLSSLAQVHRLAFNARSRDLNCKRANFVNLVAKYAHQQDDEEQGIKLGEIKCEAQEAGNTIYASHPNIRTLSDGATESATLAKPTDFSIAGLIAGLLEKLAVQLRTLPLWANWLPGAIGLGFITDEWLARRRRAKVKPRA